MSCSYHGTDASRSVQGLRSSLEPSALREFLAQSSQSHRSRASPNCLLLSVPVCAQDFRGRDPSTEPLLRHNDLLSVAA